MSSSLLAHCNICILFPEILLQLIPYFTPQLLVKAIVPLMAQSLMDIGIIEHGIVVHGCGLDEISPLGPSTVCEIKNTAKAGAPKKYKTHTYRIDPKKFGIRRCVVEDLKGGDKTQNAEELKTVLEPGSHTNAKRDSIVLNAGVGCYVYGQARSIKEGIKLARRTLEDGGGWEKLDDWIETSKLIANGKL
jgi:anthranilate phosphoribosyltransferase